MTSPTCKRSGLISWQRGNGISDVMKMLKRKKIKKSGNAKIGEVARCPRKITLLLHGETLGSSVASLSGNSSSTTLKLPYNDVVRETEDIPALQHRENLSNGVAKWAEESKDVNHGNIQDSYVAGSYLDGASWHYGENQDCGVAKNAMDINIIQYDEMQDSDVAGWYWDGAAWQYGENLDSGVAMWSGDCNAISFDTDEVERLRQKLLSERQWNQILEQELTLVRKKNHELQQNYGKLKQETKDKLAEVAERRRILHKNFLVLFNDHEEALQKVAFLTELVHNHKQVFANSKKKPSPSTSNEETQLTPLKQNTFWL